jgi:pSer/pThr/pTyr-binding forkhead associated (FHA) protein
MAETVRLTVLTGPHKGNRFCFRGSGPATLGRASDCQICFCGAERDLCISRRHCQLTFDPPAVLVNDLGSANGTYVNGQKADPAALEGEVCPVEEALNSVVAQDGDILTVGGTTLRINIMDCPESIEDDDVKRNCPAEC